MQLIILITCATVAPTLSPAPEGRQETLQTPHGFAVRGLQKVKTPGTYSNFGIDNQANRADMA